jgi:phthalate 4,5-cis-dihydrodiol dehydrogenase
MSAARGLGIVGWGVAGRLMAQAAGRTSRFRLAGIADVSPAARERAAAEAGCAVYAEAEQLCSAGGIDVIYVASPTAHHLAAVRTAAMHGKDVICEKPLACQIDDARRAVEAARAAGVTLLVGSTHSYDAPFRILRRVVADKALGPLLAVCSTCHTDWHRRPRSAADLDASQGNGLVLRQGAHLVDILRYVCGGKVDTVSGSTFGGSAGTELGFSAQLIFENGVHATAHYTGTGGFDSRLLTWGIGEIGTVDIEPSPALTPYFVLPGPGMAPPVSPVFGTTVATFAQGGAWVTPAGLLLLNGSDVEENISAGEPSGWDAVLAELDAVAAGVPPVHSGEWGLATLEVCLAIHESARTGTPVALRHQVDLASQPMPHPARKKENR